VRAPTEIQSTPGFRNRSHSFERYSTGCFGHCSSVDYRDCFAHLWIAHVIEHDDICLCDDCRTNLVEVVTLHFDGGPGRRHLTSAFYSELEISIEGGKMIVLDQYRCAQVEPVIHSAAARTAYFSSVRHPGVVFRVSRILAPVPFTASTYCRVSEATPERRCM
jgi:hypothetical protein